MHPTVLFVVAISTLLAEECDPKILRLIGPDARMLSGGNAQLYQKSALATIVPMMSHTVPEGTGEFVRIGTRLGQDLLVLRGLPPIPQVPAQPLEDRIEWPRATQLDSLTAVLGNPDAVREAIAHWNSKEPPTSPLAATVQRLSASYDVWGLIVRPLQLDATPKTRGKYRDEFVQIIQEVRFGIRLGGLNRVVIEGVTKTADDASGLAALAHWGPGLLLMIDGDERMNAVVELIDDYDVSVAGTLVTATFSLEEDRLKDLLKALEKRAARDRDPQ